jgi:hypothetical protein
VESRLGAGSRIGVRVSVGFQLSGRLALLDLGIALVGWRRWRDGAGVRVQARIGGLDQIILRLGRGARGRRHHRQREEQGAAENGACHQSGGSVGQLRVHDCLLGMVPFGSPVLTIDSAVSYRPHEKPAKSLVSSSVTLDIRTSDETSDYSAER